MVCPKCGNELKGDNLYCEVCGEEMMIVPAFEPEIENSISDVLNNVADQIDPSRITEEKKTETSSDNKNTNDNSEIIRQYNDDVVVIPKKIFVGVLSILLALVILAIGFVGWGLYEDNSYSIQIQKGDKYIAKNDYSSALERYNNAYRIDKNNTEALYKIANCYANMGNIDREIEAYRAIVEFNGDLPALETLINIYISDENYNALADIIDNYGTDDIKAKYADYEAANPVFSIEAGTYTEKQYLELLVSAEGNIYYTLDGSEPGSDCLLYSEPILLRNGTYTINAMFVNSKGICSDVVTAEYVIDTDAPDEPIVSLADGTYNIPQTISLIVPQHANVYYTVDGTEPTEMSAIYTNPIAIPLGDSVFRFVAISENGNPSEIVEKHYTLNVETTVSQEEAIQIVQNRQYEIGRVVSPDGTVEGSNGKYMYAYTELRFVQNHTLYFISEYYQEGTIRMVTGNIFGVDVNDGRIYQVVLGSNDNYTLHSF